MSPPIRSPEHQRQLKAGLAGGVLTVLATDHCPFNSTQKRLGLHDFRVIPNGVHGLEERIHVGWDSLVNSGGPALGRNWLFTFKPPDLPVGCRGAQPCWDAPMHTGDPAATGELGRGESDAGRRTLPAHSSGLDVSGAGMPRLSWDVVLMPMSPVKVGAAGVF